MMKRAEPLRRMASVRASHGFRTLPRMPGLAGTLALPRRSLARSARSAFSLIELLVVIGVIVLLAGMTFPVVTAVKRAQAIHRARAELTQIESAIQTYKEKLGFYPPDNPLNPPDWTRNQLYYELLGTSLKGTTYETLDGSARISTNAAAFNTAFGATTKVRGFLNYTRDAGSDEVAGAVPFLKGLKPAQFMAITAPGTCTVLGVSMSGAPVDTGPTGEIIPYGYCSSNPNHNTKSFDLWVDIIAGGKTNRICNWSEKPIVVYYTSLANSYPP